MLDALSELVKCGQAALEECVAIGCGLDTLGAAVEYAHPERVLQIRNRLRYDRDGNRQSLGCLGHAARLHDGNEHVQIPQLDAASDAVCPLHSYLLVKSLRGMREIELLQAIRKAHRFNLIWPIAVPGKQRTSAGAGG